METHIKSLYDKAVTVLELTKGFTPEQRKAMGNLLTTMEELAGDVMVQAQDWDELRNKVIELQRYHQTLIARYYNETMTAGEHEVLNTIIDEIDKMLIKWNSPKEV